MTLAELGLWMARNDSSIHLRASGGTFTVVAHSASRGLAKDATGEDLVELLGVVTRHLERDDPVPRPAMRKRRAPSPGA